MIKKMLPPKLQELNLKAFTTGWNLA